MKKVDSTYLINHSLFKDKISSFKDIEREREREPDCYSLAGWLAIDSYPCQSFALQVYIVDSYIKAD